jgi:hypothetical protein
MKRLAPVAALGRALGWTHGQAYTALIGLGLFAALTIWRG